MSHSGRHAGVRAAIIGDSSGARVFLAMELQELPEHQPERFTRDQPDLIKSFLDENGVRPLPPTRPSAAHPTPPIAAPR